MTSTIRWITAIAVTTLCLAGTPARAGIFTIDLFDEFSGGVEPEGTPPWLRATFEDVIGGVRLTMEAIGLTDSEFVGTGGWLFNLDPIRSGLNPLSLSFTHQDGLAAALVQQGTNAFKADGDGFFDISFVFPNMPPGARFTAGSFSVYLISGIAGLAAESFNFDSVLGGGNGTWTSAAHIQGIGTNNQFSGWIGGNGVTEVPEPSTLILLLSSLGLGLAFRRHAAPAA